MNKIIKIFTITLLFLFTINNSSATFFNASVSKNKIEITKNIEEKIDIKKIEKEIQILLKEDEKKSKEISLNIGNLDVTPIKLGDVIESFTSYYEGKIPESYKYINVNIVGIKKGTKIYKNIQKLIYVNLLPNKKYIVKENASLLAYELYRLAEKLFKVNLIPATAIKGLKARKANINDLEYLKRVLNKKEKTYKEDNGGINIDYKKDFNRKKINGNLELYKMKESIFNDVYETIKKEHYEKDTISDISLIEGATKGLAEGTGDKFTTYFPPVDNKDFQESLNGNFEGIGSYVEMEKPGVLKIISPIPGSPSEKAGLKGGDIVLQADEHKILETTSLSEAISWIKGPKGTTVELTILRNGKTLKIKVIRDKIVIKSVEYKKLDSKTYYIKLLIFDSKISSEFKKALEDLKKQRGIKKVIIDLRNNGGGYLDQVSDMLGNFVPKGLPTAIVDSKKSEQKYYSRGYDIIDFTKYKIVLLQNGGTASASEIFIGTVKDYFPKSTIIGEQSYGKGSVQTMKFYKDGSSFKYTIAHWFTGKNKNGINGIGITPDIKLEFDFENFKKSKKDNQLEKAKAIK